MLYKPCLSVIASFRTPLCVLYSPRAIASACYILAVRSTTPALPLSLYLEDAWVFPVYEAFQLEGSEESQIRGKTSSLKLRLLSDFVLTHETYLEILSALLDFYSNIKGYVPEKFWSPNPFEKVSCLHRWISIHSQEAYELL